jgi:uncharacterized protein with GYD domain
MPTYLWQVSYTSEGVKALTKDGGAKRRSVVQQLLNKVGGKLHAFYFALGEADAYVIAEVPDAGTAVAVSVEVNSSGLVNLKTTMLLSPEEFDAATKKSVGYQPPGA